MPDGTIRPTPSLEIVFEAVKGRIDEQNDRFGTLEGKATFTLGAASILTGGVGVLGRTCRFFR